MIVADLEAGVGTVSRLDARCVDRLLLVVEPSAKSIETGRRALKIAGEVGIDDIRVVASRVLRTDDATRVGEAFHGVPVFSIPEDQAVREADRAGLAPIDHAPEAPAVTAIGRLAEELTEGR